MSVYYGCSYYSTPYLVALYVCRCGRIHRQHGAVQVRKLPPGWHETSDLMGHPETECAPCHEKTLARRRQASA
jgi:hypothetical protein